MLKTHWRIVSWAERVLDNALIIVAFFLAYHIRSTDTGIAIHSFLKLPQDILDLGSVEKYYVVLGISLPLFNACLYIMGAYRSMRKHMWFTLFKISFVTTAVVFLCIGALLYLLKLDFSRSFIAIFCCLCGLFFFVERFTVLLILRFFRVRGKNFRNVLIVGTGQQARNLFFEIHSHPELGMNVQGFVDVRGAVNDKGEIVANSDSLVYDLQARVVSNVDTFETTLKRLAIDEIIFTDVVNTFPIVHELSEIASDEGVHITFTADLFSIGVFTSEVGNIGEIPLLHFHSSPGAQDSLPLFFKRVIDVCVSIVALSILFPFLVLLALCIKIDSKGPVFFKQKRVGLNGRTFTLLKFRSMVTNAEEMRSELESKNEMQGPVFKIRNDPRITRVGAFIRKYSIDEIPQFINVLMGDMSLVGPRPPLPEEVRHYKRKQRKRLSMRPGLTCVWQVSGRNEIPNFEEWAKLDLEYINNWSLKRDIILILKTIPAVIFGTGAR